MDKESIWHGWRCGAKLCFQLDEQILLRHSIGQYLSTKIFRRQESRITRTHLYLSGTQRTVRTLGTSDFDKIHTGVWHKTLERAMKMYDLLIKKRFSKY
jgi:hypothetical protein